MADYSACSCKGLKKILYSEEAKTHMAQINVKLVSQADTRATGLVVLASADCRFIKYLQWFFSTLTCNPFPFMRCQNDLNSKSVFCFIVQIIDIS